MQNSQSYGFARFLQCKFAELNSMWPQLYDGRRAGWCFITFTVGADKCSKVWDQGNGWEVSDVCDLQRPQQRAQPLCTKSGSGLNTHLSWGEYVALVLNNDHRYFQYGTAEVTDWSVTHLRGLRSMQTFSKMSLRNWGALSWTTWWIRKRAFRYSRKRFIKPTKCSAVRMLPGTASVERVACDKYIWIHGI